MPAIDGAIVVFAKVPNPGTSKTRLAPLVGDEGAAFLAQAMLSDILVSLSQCSPLQNTVKVLFYAPGTESAKSKLVSILRSLDLDCHLPLEREEENEGRRQQRQQQQQQQEVDENIHLELQQQLPTTPPKTWYLLPMLSSTNNDTHPTHATVNVNNANDHQSRHNERRDDHPSDLTSSTLGEKLADALFRTRRLLSRLESRRNVEIDERDYEVYGGNNRDDQHHRGYGDAVISPNQSLEESRCDDEHNNHAVLFLGMDSPELPLGEIVRGLELSRDGERLGACAVNHPMQSRPTPQPTLQSSSQPPRRQRQHQQQQQQDTNTTKRTHRPTRGKAHLCPAHDGGYALLSLPPFAPSSRIFSGVRWSHPLTAVSQLKALTDAGVDVSIGRLMHDVDEAEDVRELARRLAAVRRRWRRGGGGVRGSGVADGGGGGGIGENGEAVGEEDVLSTFSSGVEGRFTTESYGGVSCPYTWKALVELGVVVPTPSHDSDGGEGMLENWVVNDRLFDNK